MALDLPLLWNFISLPQYHMDQIEQYLIRSRSVHLHVFVNAENPEYERIVGTMLSTIANHISRIVTFGVRGRHLSQYIMQLPFSIISIPLLQELSLESTNPELRPMPIVLSSRQLRILNLKGAYPDPDHIQSKKLRRLVLQWHFLDIQELISVLTVCAESLEELEIVGLCTRGEGAVLGASDSPIKIPFRHLRKLVLHHNFCPLQLLLSYLEIPSNASWDLQWNRGPLNSV